MLPACGVATNGNDVRNGLSLPATPSPSCALMPLLKSGVSGVAPAITRNATPVTSSPTRRTVGTPGPAPAPPPPAAPPAPPAVAPPPVGRPWGNPATAPPRTPRGFGDVDGGIAT